MPVKKIVTLPTIQVTDQQEWVRLVVKSEDSRIVVLADGMQQQVYPAKSKNIQYAHNDVVVTFPDVPEGYILSTYVRTTNIDQGVRVQIHGSSMERVIDYY